jgi:hypothetical protein
MVTVGGDREADEPVGRRHDAWRRAALDAEVATGRHEPDERSAKASLVVRLCRITAGTLVTLLGLAMLVLPGPGLVVIAGGLSILAVDVPFARRLLSAVHRRLPRDAGGEMPRWLQMAMGGGVAVGLSLSAAALLLT